MKHQFLAKRFWTAQATPMQKAADAMGAYQDIINLSIGDSDFTTDERIIRAAMEDALQGHTKYTNPRGDPELVAEIISFYQQEYQLPLASKEVFVTTSSCFGMELALLCVLDPGDEVIIFSPYFTPYKQQIELAGGVAVEVPTYEEEGFSISEARLLAALSPRTKAIILNTPCNPTGCTLNAQSYQLIANVAQQQDLVVIADEIYTFYSFEEPFVPFRTMPHMAERTITLNSFSKNYMMAGWRIGYVVAPALFTDTMLKINENLVYTAPSVSQRAALHALRLRDRVRETYIAEYKRRVYYAYERINQIPYLSVTKPRVTFYLFVNIQKTALDSAAFCARLLEEAHLVVIPGIAFGQAGEGYFRMACTVPVEKLAEAFDRMEALAF